MANDAKSTPAIPIAVALIGVVGSVAVAWLTTQAKFSNELRDKETEVTRIKQDLAATEQRMQERQRELDAKVAAVDDRLKKLDTQIELAQAVGDKLSKLGGKVLGGFFGGGEKAKTVP